jgi:hypothetical protein
MADKKISALTSASTPLAGTEVFPLVQSGSTVKTPVSSVVTSGLTASFGDVTAITTGIPAITAIRDLDVGVVGAAGQTIALGAKSGTTPTAGADILGILEGGATTGRFAVRTLTSGSMSSKLSVSSAGDVTADLGNFVVGTADKGIDFSANAHAAGMTSELLNDYEEGTWTPNQGGGLTVVGSFGSSGKYTKIGRQVTVTGTVTGSTSIAINAGSNICTNLPFTVSGGAGGVCVNDGLNASSVIQVYSTIVTSTGAIGATAGLYFTATFFV